MQYDKSQVPSLPLVIIKSLTANEQNQLISPPHLPAPRARSKKANPILPHEQGSDILQSAMKNPQPNTDPARLLVDFIGLLPKGKALDIAMGSGRNALYLAALGFEVEGLDNDEQAIAACLDAAKAQGIKITTRQVDLEQVQLLPESYNLIICFYYLQRSLMPQMIGALRSGGIVVVETFLIDNHLLFGHPRHRDYCFEHNELLRTFRDFRVLFYREGVIEGGKVVAQIVAQKGP